MDQTLISTLSPEDETASDDAKALLRSETQKIIDALTAPEYVAALRAVRATPTEQRLAEAAKRLTPEALRQQGVKLPDGMRISSRYFESDLPKPIELGDPPDGQMNPLVQLGVSHPGLLDDLKKSNPAVLAALISDNVVNKASLLAVPMAAFGTCACGGHQLPLVPAVACGGAGVHLI
jgi:hypothetical protein